MSVKIHYLCTLKFICSFPIMLSVFLIILSGIIVGRFIRKSAPVKYVGRIIGIIIVFLLFFLGIEVGSNEQVIQNFSLIGLDAFAIASAGTLGSILCAWWVYERFFRKKKGNGA